MKCVNKSTKKFEKKCLANARIILNVNGPMMILILLNKKEENISIIYECIIVKNINQDLMKKISLTN
jgi:hypothetical protein